MDRRLVFIVYALTYKIELEADHPQQGYQQCGRDLVREDLPLPDPTAKEDSHRGGGQDNMIVNPETGPDLANKGNEFYFFFLFSKILFFPGLEKMDCNPARQAPETEKPHPQGHI